MSRMSKVEKAMPRSERQRLSRLRTLQLEIKIGEAIAAVNKEFPSLCNEEVHYVLAGMLKDSLGYDMAKAKGYPKE